MKFETDRRALLAGSLLPLGISCASEASAQTGTGAQPPASPPRPADPADDRLKRQVYFRNAQLDLYFQLCGLAYGAFGGSSFGELFTAATKVDQQQIDGGEFGTWVDSYTAVGRSLEARAQDQLTAGHALSAANNCLRAVTYYRLATILASPSQPAFHELVRGMERSFQFFAQHGPYHIERVSIPFEGKALLGYFIKASADDTPRRTLVCMGGGESYAEELFFHGACAAAKRGYNALFIDYPGQGYTAYQGMPYRADVETAVRPALDYLFQRADVDHAKIVGYGVSFGGYLLGRAAAHDHRFAAIALSTPLPDWSIVIDETVIPGLRLDAATLSKPYSDIRNVMPAVLYMTFEKYFMYQNASHSFAESFAKYRQYRYDPAAITCPCLSIIGAQEGAAFQRQTEMFNNAVRAPLTRITYDEITGADLHCQTNNLLLALDVLFDWFDDTLARS